MENGLEKLSELQIMLTGLRIAFGAVTAAASSDGASGLVFAGQMLEESLAVFEKELVRYVSRKMLEEESDAAEEGV
jgi:hypothetical protein